MASVMRQLGRPLQVSKPVLPPEGAYLWGYWLELHRTRTAGMSRANPLSFVEIGAWAQQVGEPVTPPEVRAIRAIDDAFIEVIAADK